MFEPEVGKGEGGGIFRKWREMNRNGRYIKIRYILRDGHMGCSRRPAALNWSLCVGCVVCEREFGCCKVVCERERERMEKGEDFPREDQDGWEREQFSNQSKLKRESLEREREEEEEGGVGGAGLKPVWWGLFVCLINSFLFQFYP